MFNDTKVINVALDGPSGCGKSTLAKNLSRHYGFVHIDTGSLYRAIGYFVLQNGVDKSETQKIISLLPNIEIELQTENGGSVVYLNKTKLGAEIRTPECSMYASAVSAIPEVRAFLLNLQRQTAQKQSVVMDGRDIGTVILPNADVKIFLFASDDDRASRRYLELCEKGIKTDYDTVKRDIVTRDENDRNRTTAPAIPAKDAYMLDNSGFTIEQTQKAAIEIIDKCIDI